MDQRAIHHKGGVAGSDRREEGFAKETEGLHAGVAQSGRPRETTCERLWPSAQEEGKKGKPPPPGRHTRRNARRSAPGPLGKCEPPPAGAVPRRRPHKKAASDDRAGLEAVWLVHEHNFGNGNKGHTSIRIW